jgi:glucan phosphoethanolaminetransferase (alkaline phosphatase superfamily)
MQSKGSVFVFLAILAFPVIAISADHQIFFGVIAAILAMISLANIMSIVIGDGFEEQEIDEELEEELEDLVDIDLKMFGAGLSVASHLIVILFLCYCVFYLEGILLKGVTAFAILLQLFFILKKTKNNSGIFDKNSYKPQILLASMSNVTVILFTLINKISRIS